MGCLMDAPASEPSWTTEAPARRTTMSNLTTYYGSELLPSDARRAGRANSRYRTGGQIRLARVDAETDIAIGKEEALTAVTGTAMACVVRVAKLQQQLEALAPDASGRLAYLAEDHTLGMAEVVADHRHELRRK
jgi:hypothetical protein